MAVATAVKRADNLVEKKVEWKDRMRVEKLVENLAVN